MKKMTIGERDRLIREKGALEKSIKESEFPSPKDMRRIEEIRSLLLTDGLLGDVKFTVKKRQSNRVTSFTRDRR